MFEGDLTAEQHQALGSMVSLDVPEKLAAGAWTRSEFRVLLALAAFAAVAHQPDRADLARLALLSKSTVATTLVRLCRDRPYPPQPSWIVAAETDRVPARRHSDGPHRGGRLRQRYDLAPWDRNETPMTMLPAAVMQVDLRPWARRILTVLGSISGRDVSISDAGVRTVEMPEVEARAQLLRIAARPPTCGELDQGWRELCGTGFVADIGERRMRLAPVTGRLHAYRRIDVRHPPLRWDGPTRRDATAEGLQPRLQAGRR